MNRADKEWVLREIWEAERSAEYIANKAKWRAELDALYGEWKPEVEAREAKREHNEDSTCIDYYFDCPNCKRETIARIGEFFGLLGTPTFKAGTSGKDRQCLICGKVASLNAGWKEV